MTVLSAQSIRRRQVIMPFYEREQMYGLSFGLSANGYDVRIAEDRIMWPGRFCLASTIEEFRMPDNLMAIVHDKSTWARRGLTVQNTVIEAGWSGFLTLELTLHSFKPVIIWAGSPIAQIVFHQLDEPTEQPYSGKYQNQKRGPQEAILLRPRRAF